MPKVEYYCEVCEGSFRCKDKGNGFIDYCPNCNCNTYFRIDRKRTWF